MKIFLNVITALFILSVLSCTKSNVTTECGPHIIENEDQYRTALKQSNTIIKHKIDGNCLTITLGASGCDGSSWKANLTASEKNTNSSPAKKNIAISLENDELCEAYIIRDFSFDLTKLEDLGALHLILKDYDTTIELN